MGHFKIFNLRYFSDGALTISSLPQPITVSSEAEFYFIYWMALLISSFFFWCSGLNPGPLLVKFALCQWMIVLIKFFAALIIGTSHPCPPD